MIVRCVCRQMVGMLQTKPWQQSAGSCQHYRLLTSKGVVLYDKQLNCLDMKWFKHEDIDCGIETHLGACVCAERILSSRQLQWISIDGHLVSVKPPPRESPHPHNLNSPAQLTTYLYTYEDPHILILSSVQLQWISIDGHLVSGLPSPELTI